MMLRLLVEVMGMELPISTASDELGEACSDVVVV